MNEPALLTLARLIELGACPQLELFKATFGESVDLANPPKGYETLAFDWDWAAQNLLDAPALAAYEKAAEWAERDKVTAASRAEREKARVAAWVVHDTSTVARLAAYDEAAAAAWAKYDKVTAALRAKFYLAHAAAAFVAGYVATFRRQQGEN